MRKTKRYQSLTGIGLSGVVSDLVQAGHTGLKPDVSTVLKILYTFIKIRLIRRELQRATCQLLERITNRELGELGWPRNPRSVCNVCQTPQQRYLWMRFDVPRVKALFDVAIRLITEAEFRELVKQHSSLQEEDKNRRLIEIAEEVRLLRNATVDALEYGGFLGKTAEINIDRLYEQEPLVVRRQLARTGPSLFLGQAGVRSGEAQNNRNE